MHGVEITYKDGRVERYDPIEQDEYMDGKNAVTFVCKGIWYFMSYVDVQAVRRYKLCPTCGWEANDKCRCKGGL